MGAITRKEVSKHFKQRRYTLQAAALQDVLSFVNRDGIDDPEEALELLLDLLDQEPLKSSILDKETVNRVISEMLDVDEVSPAHSHLRFIDAFVVPKYRFDPTRKVFYECTGALPIHGNAPAKASLYRDRFELLAQKLARHPHFSKPAFETEASNFGCCEIVPIQNLNWQTGRRWIMGVISQLEDGHFYLEDLTASVEVDLSSAKVTTGFFTENTIVVAEGEKLSGGIFKVNTCGFPPIENREESLAFISGLDFFGCGTFTSEETRKLADMERKAVNDMFVVLSDIWLDDEETMVKLKEVLEGYEAVEVVPSLFIFMGSFCSSPCNLSFHSFASLRSQFGKLGKMIAEYPRILEQSRFLFIPSIDDAGPSSVLPRCALPKYLTEELQKEIPNALFMSNPCRIKYYSQEIVIFRRDLLYRMRRSCLIPPSSAETSDPFAHLVATIVHQSHLCPLPLTIQPISWNHGHCLNLYPTPHTIILGDRSEQKAFKYGGVTCFNPGSFSSDHTFVAYRPCNHEVELSAI
ncbi:DNA polymerase epsilon subunit B-like [Chenopodium quinoa]|uniref:DNA polymerase epsilon subunit B-like n=1 Tax=Chenopodium quinoa TaxID=63459 RepID=UPI000B78A814|nr:DNA polymerase epsilon subunit B-like [Chenopodium quinoa]